MNIQINPNDPRKIESLKKCIIEIISGKIETLTIVELVLEKQGKTSPIFHSLFITP